MKRVLIAGGGIIGLVSAYYLSEAGHEVSIIDQFDFQTNCSPGNAGLIVPSHFIPLAAPGIVKQGIKWVFNPASPFSMNFKPDLKLLKWGLRFWGASNSRHVEKSVPVLLAFTGFSKELYQDLQPALPEMKLKYNGLIMLCRTHEKLEEEHKVAQLAERLGCKADLLDIKDICELQGNNNINALGGVYYPGDAHLLPQNFAGALLRLLAEKGVRLFPNVRLEQICRHGNTVRSVLTNQGEFSFDELIVATGAFSNAVFKQLNIRTLLQSGKGYSFEYSRNDLLKVPVILSEARVAITPYSGYTRISGAMEIGSLSPQIKRKKIEGMVSSTHKYFPDFVPDIPALESVWAGFRPCSFDGLPYIGRIDNLKNVILATGHSMMGVTLAPATGKVISELVSNTPLSFDISSFNPMR
jgi:D-amino-acid dehydrogenase